MSGDNLLNIAFICTSSKISNWVSPNNASDAAPNLFVISPIVPDTVLDIEDAASPKLLFNEAIPSLTLAAMSKPLSSLATPVPRPSPSPS